MNIYSLVSLLLLPLLIVAILFTPMLYCIKHKKSGKSFKKTLLFNFCAFFAVMLAATVLPVFGLIDAAAAAETAAAMSDGSRGAGFIAAALSIGLGSIGCGIAIAGAGPAAIGASAETPESFSKALIFVALGEGIALYAFIISFLILNKI
ncbi:MAG: ATP synthase subunit C [Oscillospiraceae bacterium]|jgi:V/A-type H+-transporting ATPase subunit K|nr:ATP synthase subunit C [Oscillospiraceae bacterium]